jgi:hypothetical protein
MCFMLYAGTDKPIPRKAFDMSAPNISVENLSPDEERIKVHFHKSEVQNIGSTSNCGCDFPHAILQGGNWPEADYYSEQDEERAASDRFNLEALVGLLCSTQEASVELYGVWSGDYDEPKRRETIAVEDILSQQFCFKERCFYEVQLRSLDT